MTLSAVFAGKNVQTDRQRGRPRFAAAVAGTVLGPWLTLAPLQYQTVGAR
ncbi:hypothetical protein [Haloarcula sp. JP-L23]|nr:hypothetical protein G9465_05680 [Haloarcula sp. JP-L23]